MRKLLFSLLLASSMTVLAAPDIGEPAPAFSMNGSDGNIYSLESLEGKGFVIAFFPKAFTGG